MAMDELVNKAKKYFPNLQFKYKNEDMLMRLLGVLLFFNPAFSKYFVTTIGNTIYWPSREYLALNPKGSAEVFIHECTHMYDEKRVGSTAFKLGYLFPQILALPILLLLFVLSWKIVVPLALLCLTPLPAPFRANFERRGYFVSMYVGYKLFGRDPMAAATHYSAHFKDASYYWMMPFGQDQVFTQEALNIKIDKPQIASEPALFNMVNDLMSVAK